MMMMDFDGDFDDEFYDFEDGFYEFFIDMNFLPTTPPSLLQLCIDHLEREKVPKTVDSAAHIVAILPDLFHNPLYKVLGENVRQFLFARATWLLEKFNHQDLQDRFGHDLYNSLVKIDNERTMALKRMASFRAGKLKERTTAVRIKNMSFGNDKDNLSALNLIDAFFSPSVNSSSHNSNNNSNSNSNSSNLNSNFQQHSNSFNPSQLYYPLDTLLQGMNWPEGVDPAHREQFLSPSCFYEVFGMTHEEFFRLKHFIQERKKKEKGLF